MLPNLPLLDQTIFSSIDKSEEEIERILECDAMFFYGEIRSHAFQYFRNFVERLVNGKTNNAVAICLKTPGGEAETVEKMVSVVRHHYKHVFFIVPDIAMSAGTIFCMSGDKIFMDYSSSLGPIDPQVPDKEGKYLVPALGYLDKVKELVEKSRKDEITPAEFAILEKQDLAMLRYYEQAQSLSIALLKKWLTAYKFKDWVTHRTTNPGTPVTPQDKEARASEIATKLADNGHWHSHGRAIGIRTLREELKLEIDDYSEKEELRKAVRTYNDTLSDYLIRQDMPFFLYNRKAS